MCVTLRGRNSKLDVTLFFHPQKVSGDSRSRFEIQHKAFREVFENGFIVATPNGGKARLPIHRHQVEALYRIYEFFRQSPVQGKHSNVAIVALPTGCGKTGVAIMSAYLLAAKRVLVLASSNALVRQWCVEF